jgi:eukaryotic-like serine/threonine-protein kinase
VARTHTDTLADSSGGFDDTLTGALPDPLFAGRFEIQRLLGQGGMGSVYRARDIDLDEVVALKVVRPELVQPDMIEHFRREVKLGRRVTHRNVARVFDLGDHEGRSFLTMELVDGESLAKVLQDRGRLSASAALHLARELAAGLEAAHTAGVVHRDLKPDNVIVARDGRVVITDFGIASPPETRAPQAGARFFGTPAYMAPEQVDRRAPVAERADLYALGVLLFEAVTGQLPWQGETPLAMAAARLLAAPPDPRSFVDVPDGLAELILALLARDPAGRPASARVVLELATPAAAGETSSSLRPTSLAPRAASHPTDRREASPRRVRVAVLPLRSRPEEDQLSAGITQDLVDGLSALPGLSVVAQIPGREAELDLARLGRELGVAVVVTGSLTRLTAARVRVSLRALTTRDGVQLWARRFEASSGEILAMNDEATREIGAALSVEQLPTPRALPDAAAIDLYLQARARFRRLSHANVEEAIQLLEAALARSPDSPMLLAAYATAIARRFFFTGLGEDTARGAAERAMAVDPRSAEGCYALAAIEFQSGHYERCIDALNEALARGPLSADAHFLRGRLLLEIDELELARQELERTIELDPGIWLAFNERARLRAMLRDWVGSELALDASASVAPSRESAATRLIHRVRLALWRGAEDPLATVLADVDAFGASGPSVNIFSLAQALTHSVRSRTPLDVPLAMRAVSSERGSLRRQAYFHQLAAEVFGHLGDAPSALASITDAVDCRLLDLAWLRRCPLLAEARELPGFAALEARVAGLVEPARERLLSG